MARDEFLEMTVLEGSDTSTDLKYPHSEQKDEVIVHQTESRSSAGGLVEVGKPYEPRIQAGLAIDSFLGIHSTPGNH